VAHQDVDALTRTGRTTASRRRLTRLGAALSLGAVGTRLTVRESAAKQHKHRCLKGCNPETSARDPHLCACCLRSDISCATASACCSGICSGTESSPGQCVGRARSARCEIDAQCASGVCSAKRRCA
jgi:hypothetical protein